MDLLLNLLYIIIGLLIFGYFYVKKQYDYWKNRGVPYIEPIFPYGNFSGVGNTVHLKTVLAEFYTKFKGQAPFVGMYVITRPVVLAIDLDLIKNILIKDFNNFTDRSNFYNERDDPLSANLFNIGGKKWKILRSKLTPTFTSGKMKFMYSTVVDVAKEFNETLSEIVAKEAEIEMKDLLARFTTDVIGTCAFGIECNSLKDPNAEFRVVGRRAFDDPKTTGFFLHFRQEFQNLARMLRIKATRDEISKFFMNVVRETVDYREKNNVRRNDFMDLLIELKNDKVNNPMGALTIEEIAAQAFVFFLAGFETSSTNMSYCLYELSLHQDLQDKLRNEINSVLDKHNKQFTYEALMEMKYLDQVVSEALRKYPALVGLTRKANNDYRIPGTKYIIEKGTRVFIPAYEIHHDPEIYPDPEKFDPDRFNSETEKERHPVSFLGFGDGPRNCIGLRFGRMQTKIGLVTLLTNYKFSTCSRTQIPLQFSIKNFVLSPEGGLWLKVEKLQKV